VVGEIVSIIKYQIEVGEDGRKYIRSEESNLCPICIGKLKVIGVRDRGAIGSDGYMEIYVIRRLRCSCCRKIHHELPDILIPYKRHCAETIENVIAGKDDICCDFSTEYRIKAWWAAFTLYFERVKVSLKMKLKMTFTSKLTPREIIRTIINTNFWVHTRTAMTPIQ
jgi:hypothetical protein